MNRKAQYFFLYIVLLFLPTVTMGKTDTTYQFRFVVNKDMFYVPWSGNGAELDRLLACVRDHKADIRWHDSGLC